MVSAAALTGFAGNELVARYRIRTGRKIGSAALIADGLHARTDGFTSLAVLIGAAGVALGWDWADPVVGLLITVAILAVLRQAAREIYRRLMDAVDPALVGQAEQTLQATAGVLGTGQVRMRWIGHQIRAECEVIVDPGITAVAGPPGRRRRGARAAACHPRLAAALVHADPQPDGGADPHHVLATAPVGLRSGPRTRRRPAPDQADRDSPGIHSPSLFTPARRGHARRARAAGNAPAKYDPR